MGEFIEVLKVMWRFMLEPPWSNSAEATEGDIWGHWIAWTAGWAWALAGLVFGALISQSLLHWVNLANSQYKDWLVIVVAVLAGMLVQLLGTGMWMFIFDLEKGEHISNVGCVVTVSSAVVLVAGLGYGIYRYLTWIGAGQREVTIAFVGGLLVKTFLIPLIKGIVTGALFKWFMSWLRGGKDTKSA